MNVLVYVNFFVVHVLSKYKRQKRCLTLLKLEKKSFIIPFLWYVSKRKREQSLLVTHSIPRVCVYVKEEIPVFHTKKFVEKCGIEKRGRPCIYPACIIQLSLWCPDRAIVKTTSVFRYKSCLTKRRHKIAVAITQLHKHAIAQKQQQ